MTSRKSIFIVGLAEVTSFAEERKQKYGNPDQLRTIIMGEIKKIQDAGYDIEVTLVDPDDFADTLKEIKEKLRSRQWDGFNVGFGVRGTPEYTDVFEQVVNAAREIVPGTKMSFNSRPDNLYECVVKNF
ncbi:hypothetical protein H2198_010830 [Neophaeococcomyces mojaviensis]|uniref:Uncharacterized protein n=1 Tax=Neophaeococcomyces mojaviensis TaxID=3383035 RepID=A0ACC2ZQP6_9EURO|nr:hypothetical protein H2198_010830 [Knufia sp. JES_112]